MPDKRLNSPSKNGGSIEKKQRKLPVDCQRSNAMSSPAGPGSSRVSDAAAAAPVWFIEYERRLDSKFDDLHKRLDFHEAACEEKFQHLEKELAAAFDKIDDLENRSRRNNLIFFNFPEGEEPDSASGCSELISSFLASIDKNLEHVQIERAHRTPPGPPSSRGHPQNGSQYKPKDRPIHVCFSSFQDRVRVRKACVAAFKEGFKYKERSKLFVAEDFSHRIQARRKALLPELKMLQQQGKRAFFVYPATIKYVQDHQLKVHKPGV